VKGRNQSADRGIILITYQAEVTKR